jgi:8-hydroxy-5-deazaflavin:NADPH oxidoreductase
MNAKPCIAILGGTGDLGSGLAKRWLGAGYPVIIGSRSAEKARAFAQELGHAAQGAGHAEAAKFADIVVLAVPFSSHDATLSEVKDAVQGKIVIDAAVPLVPPKVSVAQLPAEGSAAQIAQALLGEKVRVVSAFHTIAAAKLHEGGRADCDVLVFGNDREARDIVMGLAGLVASRGVDGGMLANSAAAEALTSVLIAINRRYKVAGASIRITGLPEPVPEGTH